MIRVCIAVLLGFAGPARGESPEPPECQRVSPLTEARTWPAMPAEAILLAPGLAVISGPADPVSGTPRALARALPDGSIRGWDVGRSGLFESVEVKLVHAVKHAEKRLLWVEIRGGENTRRSSSSGSEGSTWSHLVLWDVQGDRWLARLPVRETAYQHAPHWCHAEPSPCDEQPNADMDCAACQRDATSVTYDHAVRVEGLTYSYPGQGLCPAGTFTWSGDGWVAKL